MTAPVRLGPRDILTLGLLGLRIRRFRAALSALGVALGIATTVVVTGIPASSQRALTAELAALGTNMLQVVPAPRNAAEPDEPPRLPKESAAMVRRIGPVTAVGVVANTHTTVRRNDLTDPRDNLGLTVLAGRPGLLEVLDARLAAGQFVNEGFPTVVLGSVAAARLGIPALPAGGRPPQVVVADRWFTVVGILARTPLTPEIDRSVLVGWDTAAAELGFDGHPTVLYVRALEASVEAVRAVLPATVDPQRPAGVVVSRPSDALAAKRAAEATFSALFVGLALVALLVGGVGIANTMVVSVMERRAEIGLRRALGATRRQIRGQFLTEAVALSALGGVAGSVLGALGTAAYAAWHAWPVVIPAEAVAGGVGGAVVVGMLAGVYPSVRAARLTPTAALSAA
ncbi:ABC transporter permease [Dactylosporangium sp. NPDC049525]|uniref:ABC transporter permease n=1 Tax=Dactylosporangium sp. NPDC049525 TaxID=3154730 RepID=UPI00342753CD